jgi:hypothetical protein
MSRQALEDLEDSVTNRSLRLMISADPVVDGAPQELSATRQVDLQPRPMKGIAVAITVMN